MNPHLTRIVLKVFTLTWMIALVFGTMLITDAFADSHDIITPSVALDRDVYPVPFGRFDEFEDTGSFAPDGRSLFPVHATAIHKTPAPEPKDLPSGDLILHIRINDANFDISP